MNTILMKFFNLPPAVRMMLALAGFGGLASVLFFLGPSLKSRQAQVWILIILGAGLVVYGLIWAIRRGFSGKKARQLSGELEAQGPTRGDVAEQEQLYREKFRGKLAELKTNGLSVYKLPWFALIGEPGCGKTASLIHSGLNFPLGRDEVPGFGGTRNYNWWFTDESVILDTAGRISFHEEGTTDKTEWEYFLKLLKKNRPRCPINGVIIAVPADKLLRDTADERMTKATVLRDRLRQLHQILGVRFPTFLLITKMDLMAGFNEFFEEMRVELQQRNQMFGWSRPGEFQAPFDPSTFREAFDSVYYRLRDWEMRYLQRKASEEELGMIVAFPEAFRQLGGPLEDYVANIFQKSALLEPPFFRGFYFTSAVQEGAPILDVFAKTRSGLAPAARPTRAVDSKAFFIHDFYQKKVFAEQGLVFRSARHVTLNKRMRRMVWGGSAIMLILMTALFTFGAVNVRKYIDQPKDDAAKAAEAIAVNAEQGAPLADIRANLKKAESLRSHQDRFSDMSSAVYARMLYIGADVNVPRDHLRKIHADYTVTMLVRPVLREVENALRTLPIPANADERKRFMAAAQVYTRWYGQVVGQEQARVLTGEEASTNADDFRKLLELLALGSSKDLLGEDDRKGIATQVKYALESRVNGENRFATDILRDEWRLNPATAGPVIVATVKKIEDAWLPLTRLDKDSRDSRVRYWVRFTELIGELQKRYSRLLDIAGTFRPGDANAATEFKTLAIQAETIGDAGEKGRAGSLKEAYEDLAAFLSAKDPLPPQNDAEKRIIRLSDMLGEFKNQWEGELGGIETALKAGAPPEKPGRQKEVYDELAGARQRLEASFRASLTNIRQALNIPDPKDDPLDYYEKMKLVVVNEAREGNIPAGPATLALAPDALGEQKRLRDYVREMRAVVEQGGEEPEELKDLTKWAQLLDRSGSAAPPGGMLYEWIKVIPPPADPAHESAIVKNSRLENQPFWRPAQLFASANELWKARSTSSREFVLKRMAEKSRETLTGSQTIDGFRSMPGIARLMKDYRLPVDDLPFDVHKYNDSTFVERTRTEDKPPPAEEYDELGRPKSRTPVDTGISSSEDADIALGQTKALLRRYHTRALLLSTLRETEKVLAKMEEIGTPAADARAALGSAADVYVDGFEREWYEVYSNPRRLLDEALLTLLDDCRAAKVAWPAFVERVTDPRNDFSVALQQRVIALARESVLLGRELKQGDAIDDKVANRLKAHRDRAQRGDTSSMLIACQQMLQRTNFPDTGTALEDAYAKPIADAWREYRDQVAAIGPLTPGAPRSSTALPNLDKLRKGIVFRQATSTDSPFIAPLIGVAEYGQQLLKHHLQERLAEQFESATGHYPVVADAEDRSNDFAQLTRLAQGAMPPEEFIKFLRKVAAFRSEYRIFDELHPAGDERMKTLTYCDRWVKFLYGKPETLADKWPDWQNATVTIVDTTDPGVKLAGNAYNEFVITLPLLTESKNPMQSLIWRRNPDAGKSDTGNFVVRLNQDLVLKWDLLVSAGGLAASEAWLKDRNTRANPESFPPEKKSAWTLPATPWSLLLLLSSDSRNDLKDGRWRVPVRVEIPDGLYGFDVNVRFEREFPGTIPPLPATEQRPAMSEAARYFPAGAEPGGGKPTQ